MVVRKNNLSTAAFARIRKRMQAAAYTEGGIDWKKMFARYDKSRDGVLQFLEFKSAVRRELKLPPSELADGDVQALFGALDADSSGEVAIDELMAFVHQPAGEGLPLRSGARRPRSAPVGGAARRPAAPPPAVPPAAAQAAAAARGPEGLAQQSVQGASADDAAKVREVREVVGSGYGEVVCAHASPESGATGASLPPAAAPLAPGAAELAARSRPGTGRDRASLKKKSEWATLVNHQADAFKRIQKQEAHERRAKAMELQRLLGQQIADRQYQVEVERARIRLEEERNRQVQDKRANQEEERRAVAKAAAQQAVAEMKAQRMEQIEARLQAQDAQRNADKALIDQHWRQMQKIHEAEDARIEAKDQERKKAFQDQACAIREQIAARQRREEELRREDAARVKVFAKDWAEAQERLAAEVAAKKAKARAHQREVRAQIEEREARRRKEELAGMDPFERVLNASLLRSSAPR